MKKQAIEVGDIFTSTDKRRPRTVSLVGLFINEDLAEIKDLETQKLSLVKKSRLNSHGGYKPTGRVAEPREENTNSV